jgi:predicted ABC-type ATPase
VIAGPNGSGKTTFTNKYLSGRLEVINPDEIAFNDKVSPLQAPRLASVRQAQALSSIKSFAFETTLSGKHEVEMLRRAGLNGFKVNLVFVSTGDLAMSLGRIALRVLDGGHNVPTPDVVRRFYRSLENLPQAAALAKRVLLVDNSRERLRLLMSIENGRQKRVMALVNSRPTRN